LLHKIIEKGEKAGDIFIEYFHLIGLLILSLTVGWAAVVSYIDIMSDGVPTLKDILLLFIYLEIGAMIGIYYKTKKLPVQFLLYIAITALTRVLTIDIKTMDNQTILTLSIAILIMVLSVFVLNNYNKDDNCAT
jgi:protein PsiE